MKDSQEPRCDHPKSRLGMILGQKKTLLSILGVLVLVLVILGLSIDFETLLRGLSTEADSEDDIMASDTQEREVIYLGDTSKLGQLLTELPELPEGIVLDKRQLETVIKPYELIIYFHPEKAVTTTGSFYKDDFMSEEMIHWCRETSSYLMTYISNVDIITYAATEVVSKDLLLDGQYYPVRIQARKDAVNEKGDYDLTLYQLDGEEEFYVMSRFAGLYQESVFDDINNPLRYIGGICDYMIGEEKVYWILVPIISYMDMYEQDSYINMKYMTQMLYDQTDQNAKAVLEVLYPLYFDRLNITATAAAEGNLPIPIFYVDVVSVDEQEGCKTIYFVANRKIYVETGQLLSEIVMPGVLELDVIKGSENSANVRQEQIHDFSLISKSEYSVEDFADFITPYGAEEPTHGLDDLMVEHINNINKYDSMIESYKERFFYLISLGSLD